ncbi:hypothetical protein AMTRI_Chr13g117840 [Amborella trichopoda]
MYGISTFWYRTLKRYWLRRGYKPLNSAIKESSNGGKRIESTTLGGKYRQGWKVGSIPRLQLKMKSCYSPKRALVRARDAYVNAMVGAASSSAYLSERGGGFCRKEVQRDQRFKFIADVEKKVLFELYSRSLRRREEDMV